MKKKVNIPENAQIRVVWNVFPYDFTPENKKAIRTLTANKYGVPESQVEIMPHLKSVETDGVVGDEIKKELSDLCNPVNQLALFQKYLNVYEIKDYDWETIKSIDADVNASVNYEKYDKYKKYKLKWIKWDNFLSYGEGNFFDFEKLDGMVLMNGVPANQTGKTTFAIDLIHFLLFGRCTPLKAKTNADVFNHFKKCSEVKVEGCINIDGQDYVIRRTLTRPKNYTEKSKVAGNLEYFRVDGDNNYEALQEFDASNADLALNEENVAKTNKAIKDAIGREEDFDMIICSTSQSLAELITNTGDTERGKLITRWLGLDIIEDKAKLAKEIYAQQMGNALFKTKNKDVLSQENIQKQAEIESSNEAKQHLEHTIEEVEKTIKQKSDECDVLKSSKTTINQDLLRLDKTTIEATIKRIVDSGKQVAFDIQTKEDEIKAQEQATADKLQLVNDFGEVSVDPEALQNATNAFTKASNDLSALLQKYNDVNKKKEDLKHGEYCPTCKQKLQNVNNASLIAECEAELSAIKAKGAELRKQKDSAEAHLNEINAIVKKQMERQALVNDWQASINKENSLKLAKSALETKRTEFREQYKEQQRLLDDYNANKEAIDKNAEMDRLILNLDNEIAGYNRNRLNLENEKANVERNIKDLQADIEQNTKDIQQIILEENKEINWQIYLTMLGKNGVAKMEVRELTPILNLRIKELLSGVVDFDVEIEVTDKNDVVFNIVTTDKGVTTKANLATGSGLEKTVSALALRFVLGSITSIPQPNFFVIDEVLDGVASENYDKVKDLFDKMINSNKGSIDFVLHCTHIDAVKDWHKSVITINKTNRISTVSHTLLG